MNSFQNCRSGKMLQVIKNPHVYLLSYGCSKKAREIQTIVVSTIIVFLCLISCARTPTEPVSYVKPPSTGGEVAVAKTLETMITPYNDQDIDRHLSCFAPDARIDSKHACTVVSKVEYQKILLNRTKFATLRLEYTKFSKISPLEYHVDAIL